MHLHRKRRRYAGADLGYTLNLAREHYLQRMWQWRSFAALRRAAGEIRCSVQLE
jgi:hypothetical protein